MEREEDGGCAGGTVRADETCDGGIADGVVDNRAGSESSCEQRTCSDRNARQRHRSEAEGEGSWTERDVRRCSGESSAAMAWRARGIAGRTVVEGVRRFRWTWDRRVFKASAATAAAGEVEAVGGADELERERGDGCEGWGSRVDVEGVDGDSGAPDYEVSSSRSRWLCFHSQWKNDGREKVVSMARC